MSITRALPGRFDLHHASVALLYNLPNNTTGSTLTSGLMQLFFWTVLWEVVVMGTERLLQVKARVLNFTLVSSNLHVACYHCL